MFASTPLYTRTRPSNCSLTRSISFRWTARRIHAHAAGDGQTIRVIRDADPRPAQRQRGLGQRCDRLGAVAPRRMHLQVAAIVRRRDDRRWERRVEDQRIA